MKKQSISELQKDPEFLKEIEAFINAANTIRKY